MAKDCGLVTMTNSILSIQSVKKSFGGLDVLKGINLDIEQGKITGIIGPNGAGKSTLFDIISGYQKANEGKIIFEGKDVSALMPHLLARQGVIRTFQLTRIFRNLTVAENLLVFSSNSKNQKGNSNERAIEILELVHLSGLANAEASTLSYGQSKLLEFAQVLMHSPKILLLDEPFAGINPGLIDQMMEHLRKLQSEGLTIVLIEHNLPMVAKLCDSIAVVSNGVIEMHGAPDVIVNDSRVKEVFLGGH
jgi:ABC-type branched-subunit amino acid transport system ATPase component